MLKDNTESYGAVSKWVHWLMALVILGMFILGLWMRTLGYYDPLYQTAPHIHESIGILLAGIFLFRFVWRLVNNAPDDSSLRPAERFLSRITHKLLYGLMALILISGLLLSMAEGEAVRVFEWFSVPAMMSRPGQEELAGLLHEILAYGLIGLAALHGLAALKHHFMDKDDILKRMLPRYSDRQEID